MAACLARTPLANSCFHLPDVPHDAAGPSRYRAGVPHIRAQKLRLQPLVDSHEREGAHSLDLAATRSERAVYDEDPGQGLAFRLAADSLWKETEGLDPC